MLYRICTEDVNQQKIEFLVSQKYDGFTIVKGNGFWKQQKEKSLIIEIVAAESEFDNVKILANDIKKVNKQEAVLIQKIPNDQIFI